MKLAKIVNNIVEQIIEGNQVDFPSYVNVDGVYVGVGWTDNGNGTFTDNTPPVATPRTITSDAFIDRIPLSAYETIVNHASNEAKTFVSILNSKSHINLDNDKTVYYVGKMKTAGLINQTEHDAILA